LLSLRTNRCWKLKNRALLICAPAIVLVTSVMSEALLERNDWASVRRIPSTFILILAR
jgi:hypothetical protein